MTVEDSKYIRERVMAHNKWFEECIPMIASENLMSPLAKEMLISDFADRYAEGLPGKRYYQGNIYVDEVELKAIELAKKVFKADFADVRPISGTVANMAVLFAFANPGDMAENGEWQIMEGYSVPVVYFARWPLFMYYKVPIITAMLPVHNVIFFSLVQETVDKQRAAGVQPRH